MALTSGFFDSVSGDRKYNAEQFGSIFEGVIRDGVYKDIGDSFAVKAAGENSVTVGTGRAWLLKTWTYNDTPYTLNLTASDSVLNRIDLVVLRVDKGTGVRNNSLVYLTGVAATSPKWPTLSDTSTRKDYPLAAITRNAGKTITQANIRNVVGVNTPWVTGILENISVSTLYAHWQSEFEDWLQARKDEETNSFLTWKNEQMDSFLEWRSQVVNNLTTDAAGNLANEVSILKDQIRSLSTENALYFDLEDSKGEPVVDSYGSSVLAKQRYVLN